MRGTEQLAMSHSRQEDVIGKECLAGHLAACVNPPPGHTDNAQRIRIGPLVSCRVR
jgi:hypothetical protein